MRIVPNYRRRGKGAFRLQLKATTPLECVFSQTNPSQIQCANPFDSHLEAVNGNAMAINNKTRKVSPPIAKSYPNFIKISRIALATGIIGVLAFIGVIIWLVNTIPNGVGFSGNDGLWFLGAIVGCVLLSGIGIGIWVNHLETHFPRSIPEYANAKNMIVFPKKK